MGGNDKEGGQTQLVLLLAMVALLFVSVLVVRLAGAGDMRTRAQNGADAAALAAAKDMSRSALSMLASGIIPSGLSMTEDSAERSAGEFAGRNDTAVRRINLTGTSRYFANIVRADVRTRDCQLLREDEDDPEAVECTDAEGERGRGRYATASSIATVRVPSCGTLTRPERVDDQVIQVAYAINCAGRRVATAVGSGEWDVTDAARELFRARLVGEEGMEVTSPTDVPIGPARTGGNRANQAIGRQMAAELGWTGQQWECLRTLWINESGWNERAHNESSGAHGIPQSLPASKMASAGPDYMTNPATQIRWGLSYIGQRYGTPCSALAWWNRTDPRPHPGHWY